MTDLRTAAQRLIDLQDMDRVEIIRQFGHNDDWLIACRRARDALRAALAEPVEPVADRAAFERHAERLGYSVDPDTRKGRDGGYWSSHTQLMWLTWQAALAEPQEPDYWQEEARRYAGNADYWRKRYEALAQPVQEPVAFITPLMEQQMFDDWCPYKGSPDPRTVWAAAVDSVNGLLLGASPRPAEPVQEPVGVAVAAPRDGPHPCAYAR